MNPNLGLAQQGLKKLVNGDTRRLSGALQSQQIGKASLDEIKQVLRYVMVKLGLRERNWPEDDEKTILLRHVIENYFAHTLDEIILAFDMAMMGKLGVESKCYENFSCEYFTGIMNAYRAWAKEEYKQIPAPPIVMIEHKEDLSDMAMREWLEEVVGRVKTGKITLETVEFMPPQLYDYLSNIGEISASNAEKREYLQKAVAWRAAWLQEEADKKNSIDTLRALQEFRDMRNQGYFMGDEIDRLKTLAKKLLFFDFIQKNE